MLERVTFAVQACFMFHTINVMQKYSLSHYVKIYDGNIVLKLQNTHKRRKVYKYIEKMEGYDYYSYHNNTLFLATL